MAGTNSNPFTLVPVKARKYVYGLYGAVALVIGGFDVGYGAANAPDPTWIGVAQAVLAYLAVPIGVLAASNTPASSAEVAEAVNEAQHHDDAP